jgi:hypothetical protein
MKMSKKIVKEYLKYHFNREELAEIADAMAKSAGEMDAAEAKKKSVTAQVKAEFEAASAEHQKNARLYRDKFDYRNIDCEMLMDHVTGRVTVFRLDTGELVKSRAMTAEERQQELELQPREPEIEREPEVDEADTDTDTDTDSSNDDMGKPSDSVVDTDTDTDTAPNDTDTDTDSDQEMTDRGELGEDYEPTPEEIERGVVEHGARLE